MGDAVKYVDTPVTLAWTSAKSEAASLTVTRPDGSTVTPSVTDTAAEHTAPFTPPYAGRYVLRWATATQTFVDVLDVWPLEQRFLVSLDWVTERLRDRQNAAGTKYEALQLYIAAASALVESMVGPLLPVTKTWSGISLHGQDTIVLPDHRVTVTGITVDGSAVTFDENDIDDTAGIVLVHVPKRAKYVIEYTAGDTAVPVAAQMACLEIIAHSWQQTRQSAMPTASSDVQATPTSKGYLVPNRAMEWLQAIDRPAGLA